MLKIEPSVLKLSEFIETSSGNRISRKCQVYGSDNVSVHRMTVMLDGCVVRGDLGSKNAGTAGCASVEVGQFCLFREGSLIMPPSILGKTKNDHRKIRIGDHVVIGKSSIVEASSIASCVWIGDNCHIGSGSIIRNGCVIMDNSTVAPRSTLSPFTIYSGSIARPIGECPESIMDILVFVTTQAYYDIITWI